jgi:hypothetical protein
MQVPCPSVFGLRVSSPLGLWRGIANSSEPDLLVELGRPREPDQTALLPSEWIDLGRSPVEFLFSHVAAYRVDSGRTISITPEPQADLEMVAQVTRGAALAVALHQRGRVLLHGSCFAIGGRGVCVVGSSGTGKSTILAGMMARGAAFVSDGMTALGDNAGTFSVLVGPPELRLWPDAIERLGESPERFPVASPGWDKRTFPPQGQIADPSVPLDRVLVLGDGEREDTEAVAPSDRLFQLVKNAYLAEYVQTPSHAILLRGLAPVANAIPVRRLRRRPGPEHLDSLLDAIERDLRGPD